VTEVDIPEEVRKLFAGINMDETGHRDEAEDAGEGPWNVVPNRKARRGYMRGYGDAKPLRSRLTRKR
jgi:hypothetical protein